jgi:hypothetical protein
MRRSGMPVYVVGVINDSVGHCAALFSLDRQTQTGVVVIVTE